MASVRGARWCMTIAAFTSYGLTHAALRPMRARIGSGSSGFFSASSRCPGDSAGLSSAPSTYATGAFASDAVRSFAEADRPTSKRLSMREM